MKRVIRISQKKLNELLSAQSAKMGGSVEPTTTQEVTTQISFKGSELEFMKTLMEKIVGDSPEEDTLIEAIQNALNKPSEI